MQIRFSYATKYGTFSDALNLDDNHSFTEEEIETMKEQRRDAWIAHVDYASSIETVEEPVVETPAEEAPAETPVEHAPEETPPEESSPT